MSAEPELLLERDELPRKAYVQVPRELLAGQLLEGDATVWVLMVGHLRDGKPTAYPSRGRVMTQLGRQGRRGDTITRATSRLARKGWLKVDRLYWAGQTRNVYQPLRTARTTGGPYVELGVDVLTALRDGRLSPGELIALARWYDAGGIQGWTRDTLDQHARTYHVSARTAKNVRARLVALGLLDVRYSRGAATVTARPGCLPESGTADASSAAKSRTAGASSIEPKWDRKCVITRTAGASSLGPLVRPEVPPVEVPPVEVPAASRVETSPRSYVPDAREIDKRGEESQPSQNGQELAREPSQDLPDADEERQAKQAVELCVETMPTPQRERMARRRDKSLAAALPVIRAGWAPQDIRNELGRDWGGVYDPDSALAARLPVLLTTPAPSQDPAWMVRDEHDRLVPPPPCEHEDPRGAKACPLCRATRRPDKVTTRAKTEEPSADGAPMPEGFRAQLKTARGRRV